VGGVSYVHKQLFYYSCVVVGINILKQLFYYSCVVVGINILNDSEHG